MSHAYASLSDTTLGSDSSMTLVNPENPTSYQPLTRDRVHMLSYQGNHYLRIDAVPVGSNVSSEGEADDIYAKGIWDII